MAGGLLTRVAPPASRRPGPQRTGQATQPLRPCGPDCYNWATPASKGLLMPGGALGAPRVDRRGFLRSLGLGGLALALGARPQAAAAAAQPPRVGSPAKIGAAPADELQAAA